MAATFLQTNFNTQDPTTYRGAIDANFAVAAPIVDNFAPRAAATPNMTVLLDAGAIPAVGGMPVQIAQQTSAVLVAPAANPRRDIVHIDNVTGLIGIATGAEAASPVDPAIPAGKIPLARVAMTVGMTTIPNTIITDLRAPVMALGGVKFQAISASATLTTAQSGTTFKLSGAAVTLTLPTPIGNAGTKYRFVGTDANTQSLVTPAATFNAPDGTTSTTRTITNNQVLDIESDGSVWRIMGMEGYAFAYPAGMIDDFGGPTAPTGYLACDGAAVSRTIYAALFTAIGTFWGAGDGTTTFNVPSFLAGEAAVQTAGTVGASTDGQMPAHTHPLGTVLGAGSGTANPGVGADYTQLSLTGSTGSGTRNFAAGKRVLKCIKT